MAWVYLDDQFPDHPKVVAAGGDAAWLFVSMLCYARRFATEGFIPDAQITRLTDRRSPRRLAQKLVSVGLLHLSDGGWTIHDYADWNKPATTRSEAGRKAAAARWSKDA